MGGTLQLWISLLGIMVSNVGGSPHEGLTNLNTQKDSEGRSPMYLRSAWPQARRPLWQDGPRLVPWPRVRYSPPVAQERGPSPATVHMWPNNANFPQVPYSPEAEGSLPQTGSRIKVFEAAPVNDPPEPVKGQSDSSAPGSVPVSSVPAAEPVPVFSSAPDPETVLVLPNPPAPMPPSQQIYKPGKVIRQTAIYKHGNEESEFHDTGDLLPPHHPHALTENSDPEASSLELPEMEHDDQFFQMFLTGQLPPGTITHISSTYEHGHNEWTNIGFERMPL